MGTGELAKRLKADYREMRYVMEQGVLPRGAAGSPGRGEHRDLSVAQAYWLAVVMSLKAAGVGVPVAGSIAQYAEYAVHGVTRRLNWDHNFMPFQGRMDSEFLWYLDVADRKYCRLVTTANPSGGGRLEELLWVEFGTMREAKGISPVVYIRIDLGGIARLISA